MALSPPPMFQGHEVDAQKSYLQPALWVKEESEKLRGRAGEIQEKAPLGLG